MVVLMRLCSKELLNKGGCMYTQNVAMLRGGPLLRPGGPHAVWDVEELLALGKKRKGPPPSGPHTPHMHPDAAHTHIYTCIHITCTRQIHGALSGGGGGGRWA
jgi:hypothetical protein